MTKLIFQAAFFVCVLGSVLHAQQTSTEIGSDRTDTLLSLSVEKNLEVAAFGNKKIVLYRDHRPNPGASDQPRTRLYVKPVIIADWKQYGSEVKEVCESENSGEAFLVTLPIKFYSNAALREIASHYSISQKISVTTDDIHAHPFSYLEIVVGGLSSLDQVPEQIILQYPTSLHSLAAGSELGVDPTFPSEVQTVVRGTCDQLTSILERRDVGGHFYTSFSIVNINAGSARLSQVIESEAFRKLLREEEASGVITTRQSGGRSSAGLNLKIIGLGRTSSSARSTHVDSRKRAVSGNVIQEAVERAHLSLAITGWQEESDTGESQRRLLDLIVEFIKSNSTTLAAKIEKVDDQTWKISSDQINRTLSTSEVALLVETSTDGGLVFGGQDTFGCGGASDGGSAQPAPASTSDTGSDDEPSITADAAASLAGSSAGSQGGAGIASAGNPYCGSSSRNTSITDKNGIKYQRGEGDAWIPTSVELYLISESELSIAANAQYADVIVRSGGAKRLAMDVVQEQSLDEEALHTLVRKSVEQEYARIDARLSKLNFRIVTKPWTNLSRTVPIRCPSGMLHAPDSYLEITNAAGGKEVVNVCYAFAD